MGKPLSLDDVRVSGPDRDNADAFNPGATWEQARGFAEGGYGAATVADVLDELRDVHPEDAAALLAWINDHPQEKATTLFEAWAKLSGF